MDSSWAAKNNPLSAELYDELVVKEPISAGSNRRVQWRCKTGHLWWASPKSRGQFKGGCAVCASQKNGQSFKRWPENPLSSDLQRQLVTHSPGISAMSGKRVLWRCELGHEWETPVYNRSRGSGCPKCSSAKIRSAGEQELLDFVISAVDAEVVSNDRSVIKPREIDVYLPGYNIGIEYNGSWYHSISPERDAQKLEMCRTAGVQLLVVWDYEWEDEGCKTLVLSWLSDQGVPMLP